MVPIIMCLTIITRDDFLHWTPLITADHQAKGLLETIMANGHVLSRRAALDHDTGRIVLHEAISIGSVGEKKLDGELAAQAVAFTRHLEPMVPTWPHTTSDLEGKF